METETSERRESLYKRLGGYDVIAGVVAGLFKRLRDDPRLARFGMGRSLNLKARVQQLTVERLCALAGGPCIYLSRDMKTSHRGRGPRKPSGRPTVSTHFMFCKSTESASPNKVSSWSCSSATAGRSLKPRMNRGLSGSSIQVHRAHERLVACIIPYGIGSGMELHPHRTGIPLFDRLYHPSNRALHIV